LEKVMNNADYVIMNEKTSTLIRRSESTIVTRGKKGCQCGDIIIKGIPVNTRDTTGAGDAFCAGFMYQIVKGNSLEKALEFGNAAAAASTTVYGAMDSMPSREAVESLL
jgi:ribokinase